MKRGSTLFLRAVILLMGLGILSLCIFILPIGLRSSASGYYRPILLCMYVAAVPFFMALYQSLKLLNYIDKNSAFSELGVVALRKIKYCAITISGLFLASMPYIIYAAGKDDAPGVAAIGFIIIAASCVIATFAAVLQKLLQNAIEIKSENELTV
jgi:hypothetical protein